MVAFNSAWREVRTVANCKKTLKHAVTGEVLLVCDLQDDVYHSYCLDRIHRARWREDFSEVGVTRLTPASPLKEAADA